MTPEEIVAALAKLEENESWAYDAMHCFFCSSDMDAWPPVDIMTLEMHADTCPYAAAVLWIRNRESRQVETRVCTWNPGGCGIGFAERTEAGVKTGNYVGHCGDGEHYCGQCAEFNNGRWEPVDVDS